MGNVLTDGNGNVLISNNNALEVTSAIDSNIQAGNIKKDVTILGVTGTYEGSGGGGNVPVVIVNGTTVSQILSPNTHYVFGCVDSLTITLDTPVANIVNEYTFEFDSGNTPTVLTLPNNIEFELDTTVNGNKHYEYSIKYNQVNNVYFGLLSSWTYITLPDNSILIDGEIEGGDNKSGIVLKKSSNYNTTNGINVYYLDSLNNTLVLIGTANIVGSNLEMYTYYGDEHTIIYTASNPETYTAQYEYVACFAVNTDITLVNGTKKKVQDVDYDDDLLVWDFDNGELSSAKPLWITRKLIASNYHRVYLSDGTYLDLIGTNSYHRLYDVDNKCFTPSINMSGRNTIKEDGTIVKVINWVNIEEKIEYYNIITNYHINCYAKGILASCRYNSIYPISEDMKYIKDNRQIIPYEAFENKIDEKYYYGLRVGELQFTIDEVVKYCDNMVNTRKEGK